MATKELLVPVEMLVDFTPKNDDEGRVYFRRVAAGLRESWGLIKQQIRPWEVNRRRRLAKVVQETWQAELNGFIERASRHAHLSVDGIRFADGDKGLIINEQTLQEDRELIIVRI